MDNEVRIKKVRERQVEFNGKRAKIANALRNLGEEKERMFLAVALGETEPQKKAEIKEKIRKLEEELKDLDSTIEALEKEEKKLRRYI